MANGRAVNILYDPADPNHKWTSIHQNATQVCGRLYNVVLPPIDLGLVVQDMADTAAKLQDLLKQALATTPNPTRVHCIGSGWSLSTAPIVSATSSDVWILSTFGMRLCWKMQATQINAAYNGPAGGGLYLVQAGKNVGELNQTIEGDGQSLPTSGASDGQTIAGAVSTGTHGSAFTYGSMPEFVVGIHLITGPTGNIWLERNSYPVVKDDFVTQLGATLLRDDDAFNAALVSFGSMGIVAGLMVETVPKYLLRGQRIFMQIDDGFLQAMNTMDLSNLNLNNPGLIPWHFEVTFLPGQLSLQSGTVQGHGFVQTFYKHDFPPDGQYDKPNLPGGISPGASVLGFIGKLAKLTSPKWFQWILLNALPLYPKTPKPVYGTSGETFTGGVTTQLGSAMSMELGIPAEQAATVLQLMVGLPAIKKYLGVISYRWVKQSSAMLGWAKFPLTATIEFNAAFNDNTTAFYEAVWKALSDNGVPFTLHWGQMNNFSADGVRKMYGAAIDTWLAQRNKLLDRSGQHLFTTDFLLSTGLDISQNPVPF